jgi:hypothetical protein
MPKSCLALFIIFLLILSACSINQLSDESARQLLIKECAVWQNFRLDGVITISADNYNLIKDVSVSRDSTQLKLFIYDSGLFGAAPAPFAKVVIADSIYLHIPSLSEPGLYSGTKELISSLQFIKQGLLPQQEILQNYPLINDTKELRTSNEIYYFDSQMQLSSVEFLEHYLKIDIMRDLQGVPSKMEIFYKKKLAVTIEIDTFLYMEQ